MFLLSILVVVIGTVLSQHHQQLVPLKEIRHLQAIQQPHLPQDMNVLAATQQFLHQFAQLKALADAAPDPPAHSTHHVPAVQHPHGSFVHNQQFNPHHGVHQHHVQHQPQHSQHQQHVQHQPQQSQQVHHGHVPVRNHQGIVVNPNQYPGPLAHSLPAGVHGR